MRIAAAAAFVAAACANIGSPPGGPTRTAPPALKGTSPDSGAVNVRADGVVFEFDAIVSDRNVQDLFLISPRDGAPRIRWRRSRVEVRPRDEFRANTAYAVTLLPGITDLNNNVMRSGKTVVFSTGPAIPQVNIAGRVFDWTNERVAADALIEAIRLPDSLPYVGVSDSSGQFAVGPLDDGTYLVRALMDNNRNRAIDAGEPWDTARIVVRGGSPVVELLAAPRDSAPPRLLTVLPSDSLTIVASFDKPLDPSQSFLDMFRLQRQDSSIVRIVSALTRGQRDSVLRARPDTTDTTRAAARPADPRVSLLESRTAPPRTAHARPSKPPPPMELTLLVDSLTPLKPAVSYRLTAIQARGLSGLSRTSDRLFQLPPPAVRRDTTPGAPAVRPL